MIETKVEKNVLGRFLDEITKKLKEEGLTLITENSLFSGSGGFAMCPYIKTSRFFGSKIAVLYDYIYNNPDIKRRLEVRLRDPQYISQIKKVFESLEDYSKERHINVVLVKEY